MTVTVEPKDEPVKEDEEPKRPTRTIETPEGDEVEVEETPPQTPMTPNEAVTLAKTTEDTTELEAGPLHGLAETDESGEPADKSAPKDEELPPGLTARQVTSLKSAGLDSKAKIAAASDDQLRAAGLDDRTITRLRGA